MPTTCKDDDGGSIAVGDAVCVSGWDGGTSRPKVKRALASNLMGANTRTILGVVSAAPGVGGAGTVDVKVAGEVADVSITGLTTGAGTSRLVVTDYDNATAALQCKLRHIDDSPPAPERFVVGSSDQNGTLAIQPRHNSEETAFPRVVNIRAYGGIGDGRFLTDVSVTSGSNVLTSASAPFTSNDVGKPIRVVGGAANSTDLVTTIAGFTSATTITLAAAAGATFTTSKTAAVLGTDDTTALTNALDAVPSTGGTLFFPSGAYVVTSNVTIPTYAKAQFDDGAMLIASSAKVTIQGRIIAHPTQRIFGGIGVGNYAATMVYGTAGDPIPSLTGTAAYGIFAIRIEITTGGARGVAQFRYTMDGGLTWASGTTAASFPIPGTGVAIAFPTGIYVTGALPTQDVYRWACTPAILFEGLSRSGEIHAAWFGPTLDGTVDDAPAIQAALDSTDVNGSATVVLPPTPLGVQAPRLRQTLRIRRGHIVQGSAGTQSDNGTVLYAVRDTPATDPTFCAITVESGATSDDGGNSNLAVLQDFAIVTNGPATIPVWTSKQPPAAGYSVGDRVALTSAEAYEPATITPALRAPTADPRYFLEAVATTGGGHSNAVEPLTPGPPVTGIGQDVEDVYTAGPPQDSVTWRARVHSGIYAKSQCYIKRVRISGFTNAGITYAADHATFLYPAGPGFGNLGGAEQCTIDSCGLGVFVIGGDANNSVFRDVVISSIGGNLYGSPLPPNANALAGAVAIWNEAQIGATYDACSIDTVIEGRAIYSKQFAFNSGSVFMAVHEEAAAYPNHLGAGMWFGGSPGGGFTDTSQGTVLLQGSLKNIQTLGTPTFLAGVTTDLVLPGVNDPVSPNNGALAGGSSDGSRWQIFYGVPWGVSGLPGFWGLNYGTQPALLAWTATGAADAVGPLGTSLAWLPRGAFRGNSTGYPDTYEFANEQDIGLAAPGAYSSLIRGGRKVKGDRYRTPDVLDTYGAPSERVVLVDGYEAPPWPGAGLPIVASATDPIISSLTYRSSKPGQTMMVFQCAQSGTTGAAEPTPPGGLLIGQTFAEGPDTLLWKYVGDVATVASTILGVTVTGTSINGNDVDLTDEHGLELVLPDSSSFALRVTILASRTAGGAQLTERDVYEVSAFTTGGAITATADRVSATNGITGAWDATIVPAGTPGTRLRIRCHGGVGETVLFLARVEFTVLPGQ